MQAVFRSLASLEKTVEKCHIELDKQKSRLTFTLHCKHGNSSFWDGPHSWMNSEGLHLIDAVAHHAFIAFYSACDVCVSVLLPQACWRHITCLSRTVKVYRQCLIRTAVPMYSGPSPGLWDLSVFFIAIILQFWLSTFCLPLGLQIKWNFLYVAVANCCPSHVMFVFSHSQAARGHSCALPSISGRSDRGSEWWTDVGQEPCGWGSRWLSRLFVLAAATNWGICKTCELCFTKS